MDFALSYFLLSHNFVGTPDFSELINSLLFDMNQGLLGKKSDEDMIATFIPLPKKLPKNKTTIVIDAGGTNFRSCLVSFDEKGSAKISDLKKTKMPGLVKELSKKEFFFEIANRIDYLKGKANNIGFCFSYAMQMTKDGDGILKNFSKEIKASEVQGSAIGASLREELCARGWKNLQTIALLNDTVSSLLSGFFLGENDFSSRIGFILGTGLNAAYVQKRAKGECEIIVCESGKFSHLLQSDFDKTLDEHSVSRGASLLEKQTSGAYLGELARIVLNEMANENLFSKKCADEMKKIENLSLIDFDIFLHKPNDKKSLLGKIILENGNERDSLLCFQVLDSIVKRASANAAAILCACVLQSREGETPAKPVCIMCNGSTFFKTYKMQSRIEAFLETELTEKRGKYFKLCSIENDITLGSALVPFIRV